MELSFSLILLNSPQTYQIIVYALMRLQRTQRRNKLFPGLFKILCTPKISRAVNDFFCFHFLKLFFRREKKLIFNMAITITGGPRRLHCGPDNMKERVTNTPNKQRVLENPG